MTEYKKIIYIDTDTMALKVLTHTHTHISSFLFALRSPCYLRCRTLVQNIDHLALEPSFTAVSQTC